MSVTLDDVRLARKRAYDRVRYELEKRSDKPINVGSAGFTLIPVPKHATQAELEYLYRYFTELRVENVESYLRYEYEVHDIEKPTSIKNPYAREYRYKKSDEYFSSGYTPDEFFDDYELREQIYSDEADYESQVADYEEEYSEPEPEPPEPEPAEDEWEDDYWQDSSAYGDDDTAPNYFESVDEIINRGYEYGNKIGEALEEAMNNLMNVLGVDDEEEFAKSLGNMDDVFSEFEKAKEYLSKLQEEDSNNTSSKLFKSGMDHLNRGLSQLYKKVGLLYTRGI